MSTSVIDWDNVDKYTRVLFAKEKTLLSFFFPSNLSISLMGFLLFLDTKED